MELNREFVEMCLEDENFSLYTLNQRYRVEIDNIRVFEKESKETN